MRTERFEDQVARAWSAHIGCAPEDLERPGTILVPLERLAGSGAVHLTRLRGLTLAEIAPELEGELQQLLSRVGPETALTASILRRSVPPQRVQADDRGHIFHLDPDRPIVHTPAPPFTLRALTALDQESLQALLDRCQPNEVDDAYVDTTHEIACGCFVGERMVACGSGYRRHGFMDLGVLTDPGFRGRHLATAIVAALSHSSLSRGVVLMYRCDEANAASRRVAEEAGFTRCFTTESLTLAIA